MKKNFKQLGWAFMMGAALVSGSFLTSCSDNEDSSSTPEGNQNPTVTYKGNVAYSDKLVFNGNELGNGDQEYVLTGDVTLEKGTYTMKGWIYIADGAKLTIPAGTVIKGDKKTKAALIIEPGGYAQMEGTKDAPIVMTSAQAAGSRKPGDWGGLIVCGKAKNNQIEMQIEGGPRTKHGGSNDADNSGIFRYIRVEFAGYPFDTDKEINGITFGSVGSGTTVDHLQVSYSNDDSYEWFGGTVNVNNIIAYKGWDDDFDTDNGFSGNVQYCLSVRDPRIADTSQSNGFESDNCASGDAVSPYTKATFKNVTFIGPMVESGFQNSSDYINGGNYNPNNGSKLGKFQAAMQIRRSSQLNGENILAVGFPIGIIIDGEKGSTPQYATEGKFHFNDIILAGMGVTGSDNNKKYEDELCTGKDENGNWIYDATQKSFSTTWFTSNTTNRVMNLNEINLTDPKGYGFNYCPAATIDGSNNNYIGAFKDSNDNWMDGWTNFDPQNTQY